VAAYDSTFQVAWDDPIATKLSVNLGDQELTGSTNLLLLCLDLGPRNLISQDDPLGMQLDSTSLVGYEVIDLDELLAVNQHVSE
jgi:hypothetical protein